MNAPLVSICIHAYKKVDFVRRALDSVRAQQYPNIEVVVTDDSPDASLGAMVTMYQAYFPVNYLHNPSPLGSPGNWNKAISLARGEMILLLHQDDWLSGADSIATFVAPFLDDPQVTLVFGRSRPVDRSGKDIRISNFDRKIERIRTNPNRLILGNLLGHPSNLMVRNGLGLEYDPEYIWLVDFEFYRRVLLAGGRSVFIDHSLVEVGVHADQITNQVGEDRDTLLKEHLLFAERMGAKAFQDIDIYDHYWRLFRNQGVRGVDDLTRYVPQEKLLPLLKGIARTQCRIPPAVLRVGLCSKALMFLSYTDFLIFRSGRA